MKYYVIILALYFPIAASAQTLGGNTAFNFLKLPSTPVLSANGGANITYSFTDVGLAQNNPALLNPLLSKDINFSFNDFFGGINAYSLSGAWNMSKLNMDIGASLFFIDYGNINQTDAGGNIEGEFHPRDFVFQLSASKPYMTRWRWGTSFKFISSTYGRYSSDAIAFDGGILYADSSNLFQASIVVKNAGVQLKAYGTEKEDLPFDLQIGVSKKLKNAPLGFSITAFQLHNFNLLYEDESFNQQNNITANHSFFSRLANHFVIASHIYLGKHLEASVAYNHLRRSELNIDNTANGLNGFSAGLRAMFRKLEVQYARSYFQKNIAYNHFGITMHMRELFGISD